MNVVLVGMKGCGKSTLGRALAQRWGCRFYDVDQMIEATHACDTGRPQNVREIFDERGEGTFRKMEGMVVCDLYMTLNRPDSAAVVGLGGRTALNPSVAGLLGGIGVVVYLKVPPEELWARLQRGGLPPFLDASDPRGAFQALYDERTPQYERLADLVVDLGRRRPEEAVEVLDRSIQEHAHAG